MTGTASSVFFIIYAIGQLINGLVGNKIKARYMMGFGLLLAGICNIFDCVYWGFCIRTYEEYGQINTALIQCCGGDRGIATLWCGI